jgi:hypothetical protein
VRTGRGTPLNIEADDGPASAHRQADRGARRLHAGDAAGAIQDAIEEAHPLGVVAVPLRRKRHVGDQQIVDLKTGLDRLQPVETAQQQSRAHKEHEREGNFADHEKAAEAVLMGAAGRSPARLVKHRPQIRAGGLRRGHEPEEQPGDRRGKSGESQDPAVDADGRRVGNGARGQAREPGESCEASASPARPPRQARVALSARSCSASRAAVAPSAVRTAISRRRDTARASIKPATLAHAISSTSPTAHESASSAGRIFCTI